MNENIIITRNVCVSCDKNALRLITALEQGMLALALGLLQVLFAINAFYTKAHAADVFCGIVAQQVNELASAGAGAFDDRCSLVQRGNPRCYLVCTLPHVCRAQTTASLFARPSHSSCNLGMRFSICFGQNRHLPPRSEVGMDSFPSQAQY